MTPPEVADPVFPELVEPVEEYVLFPVWLVALPVFPPVVEPVADDDPLLPPVEDDEFPDAFAFPELPPVAELVASPDSEWFSAHDIAELFENIEE